MTYKDVSQSTNIYEISEVLQLLNSNAEIRVTDINKTGLMNVYSSVKPECLNLPLGFYYNEKNGITNKYNTKNGQYVSIIVEDLKYANEEFLLPRNCFGYDTKEEKSKTNVLKMILKEKKN